MTRQDKSTVLGIDVGTSGVRSLAVNSRGEVIAEAQTPLLSSRPDPQVHEQNPDDWWAAVCVTVKSVFAQLAGATPAGAVLGVAVTSTSGSLVLCDGAGRPVRPAILYDDSRGAALAAELNPQLPARATPLNTSYSLLKAIWVSREEPAVWERARLVLQPADWLTGKLTGAFGIADDSNALKLGYHADRGTWSPAAALAGIPQGMFPQVVCPGTAVGAVCTVASAETDLPLGTAVYAGATDGMAGLIASGAHESGHANTTLGTTLVWKALAGVKPQLGPGMYCHRHPTGLWAPGAASNSGPGSLLRDESGVAPSELDRRAAGYLPSPTVCYLLRSEGERFPFLNPHAQTFFEGNPATGAESRAAQLQSLAFTERWGYERLEQCGLPVGNKIFSTGSAAGSPVLSQLRANVLNRQVCRGRYPVAALGAAILAATQVFFDGNLQTAIPKLTQVFETFSPQESESPKFQKPYHDFRAACTRRAYL
jgi:D-ribulokinase